MAETRTLTIAGSRGDQLAARLDMPDGDPRAVALMAHQFSGGNAGPAVSCIARSFNEQSVAVLSLHVAGNELDHIQRELTFDGDLSDEQRARLLAIAERCPVHRTLRGGVQVSTAEST